MFNNFVSSATNNFGLEMIKLFFGMKVHLVTKLRKFKFSPGKAFLCIDMVSEQAG